MLTEKELIENLAIHLCDAKWSEDELIRMLTKLVDSINSTRLSERRDNGSNSKAKEFLGECQCTLCGKTFKSITSAWEHDCPVRRNA